MDLPIFVQTSSAVPDAIAAKPNRARTVRYCSNIATDRLIVPVRQSTLRTIENRATESATHGPHTSAIFAGTYGKEDIVRAAPNPNIVRNGRLKSRAVSDVNSS